MKGKKNLLTGIVVAILILILIGMIIATAILSASDRKNWDYISADENLNYNAIGDVDFAYMQNFRQAMQEYLGNLFDNFLSEYTGLQTYIKSKIDGFTDDIIAAFSEARIPAVKINQIASAVSNATPGKVFNRVKETLNEIGNIDALEKYLSDNLKDFTLFKLTCGFVSDVMQETSLTENDIAEVLYYYLFANQKDDYLNYLNFLGKDYFISLASNTIYAMSTFNDLGQNEYLLQTTAQSIRTVLYQLGSLYKSVALLSGGSIALEKVLGINYDTALSLIKKDYEPKVRGKIGDMLSVIGCFFQALSADDIEYYCRYLSEEEGRDKSDLKIYCAYRFSQTYQRAEEEIYKVTSAHSVSELSEIYQDVSYILGELGQVIFDHINENQTAEGPIDYSEYYDNFATAINFFNNNEIKLNALRKHEIESTEYVDLLQMSENFFGIEKALMGICDNLITIRISEPILKLLNEGD